MFHVKVSGFTPAGYSITFECDNVTIESMKKLVDWFDERLTVCACKPAIFSKSAPAPENGNGGETQMCPIHKVPMERHTKGKGSWFSHKVAGEDGAETWCRGT
jgi:hypothetical protein